MLNYKIKELLKQPEAKTNKSAETRAAESEIWLNKTFKFPLWIKMLLGAACYSRYNMQNNLTEI